MLPQTSRCASLCLEALMPLVWNSTYFRVLLSASANEKPPIVMHATSFLKTAAGWTAQWYANQPCSKRIQLNDQQCASDVLQPTRHVKKVAAPVSSAPVCSSELIWVVEKCSKHLLCREHVKGSMKTQGHVKRTVLFTLPHMLPFLYSGPGCNALR